MPNNIILQQISKLLDEKLVPICGTLVKHGEQLDEHGELLKEHGEQLDEHGELLKEHGKVLKSHGKLLKSLKKGQDTMLTMLDTEQMNQRKRLERVEKHLELTTLSAS